MHPQKNDKLRILEQNHQLFLIPVKKQTPGNSGRESGDDHREPEIQKLPKLHVYSGDGQADGGTQLELKQGTEDKSHRHDLRDPAVLHPEDQRQETKFHQSETDLHTYGAELDVQRRA